MAMERSRSAAAGGGPGKSLVDEKLKGLFPRLHEFLTENVWEDAKPRKTGSLMLVVEDGWWKLWLHDRDAKMSSWHAGTSVDDVMLMAEDALERGSCQWRVDRR